MKLKRDVKSLFSMFISFLLKRPSSSLNQFDAILEVLGPQPNQLYWTFEYFQALER